MTVLVYSGVHIKRLLVEEKQFVNKLFLCLQIVKTLFMQDALADKFRTLKKNCRDRFSETACRETKDLIGCVHDVDILIYFMGEYHGFTDSDTSLVGEPA